MNWYLGILAITLWLGATGLYFSRQIVGWLKRVAKRRAVAKVRPKPPAGA